MLGLRLFGLILGGLTAIAEIATPCAATPCSNLQTLALEHTTITLATDITSGVFTVPGSNPAQDITGLPAFCRVAATIAPTVDSAIKIEVWLPASTWSGRFLGLGSGGFGGYYDYGGLAFRLKAGYAVAYTGLGTGTSGCTVHYCGSDGNKGNALAIALGDKATPSLGLYGHPERITDFGHRAVHLMTLRAKEIVQAYYQQSATRAYFFGCSTGGHSGLMEAQRYPEDYDGILVGAPAYNRTHLYATTPLGWRNTHATPGRQMQAGQMSLINNAILAQCAGRDGGVATDQFLTNPRRCRFDPKVLQCTGGDVPPACLTEEQVTTMQNYYAGTVDPVTGERIVPGFAPGSETEDLSAKGIMLKQQLPEPLFDGPLYWVYGPTFGQPGSAANYTNFDIHRDLPAVEAMLAEPLNATSPDLTAFRERGGRLIMYQGWADELVMPQNTIDYFNSLVKFDSPSFATRRGDEAQVGADVAEDRFGGDHVRAGLQRTLSYARLYMVPGMYHCGGGPGPNAFVFLPALQDWVENGTPPGSVVATKYVNDTAPDVQMTRPLCVFPKIARYNGRGSTDDAASFSCVEGGHRHDHGPHDEQ
ncbi:tannase/feruloyl esterase family alpha/beta hydrolase [Bradyrhizobium oligotrophicum]|uniref:tannase/feruloyl esterase family alpha/beta hydrolase n=1 Tax=Bradyrhizobium oligotrophicum TaxID=44255 RepID=UPI003EB919DB